MEEANIQTHSDSHDIVRCQLSTPDDNTQLSNEERLAHLEKQFVTMDEELHRLDSKVDDRFQRVEELLRLMLGKMKNEDR